MSGASKVFADRGARLAIVDIDPKAAEVTHGLGDGHVALQVIASRRFAQPEEIALAALSPASPAAGMINGADLAIDGYTIQ